MLVWHVGLIAIAASLEPIPDDACTRNCRIPCAAPAIYIAPPNGSMVLPSESVRVRVDVVLHDAAENVLGRSMVLVHLIDGRFLKRTNLSESFHRTHPVRDVWGPDQARTTAAISFRREFHPAPFKGARCSRDMMVTIEDTLIFSAAGWHELQFELRGQDAHEPMATGSTQILVRWSDRIGGVHEHAAHPPGDLAAESRERIKARRAMTLLARDLFTLEASKDRALRRSLLRLRQESSQFLAIADSPRVLFLVSLVDGYAIYADGHPLGRAGGFTAAGGISAKQFARHFDSGEWLTGEPYLNEGFLGALRRLNADVMFFETPGGELRFGAGCQRFHRFDDPLIWPPFTLEHPQNQSCDPVYHLDFKQRAFVAQYDMVVSTNLLRFDGPPGENPFTELEFPANMDTGGDGFLDVHYIDAEQMWADISLKLTKQVRLYLPTYAFSTLPRHFHALKPRLDELGYCPVKVWQYNHQSEIPHAPWWWTYDVAAIRALRPLAKNNTVCEFPFLTRALPLFDSRSVHCR
jgi:hypothetical protein